MGVVVRNRLQLRLRHIRYRGATTLRSGPVQLRTQDVKATLEAGKEGPLAEFAAGAGTDWPTFTREQPGMSAFALDEGVVYHTPTRPTRAAWTGSGACTSGSTGRPEGGTRPGSGFAVTTSTTSAEPSGSAGQDEDRDVGAAAGREAGGGAKLTRSNGLRADRGKNGGSPHTSTGRDAPRGIGLPHSVTPATRCTHIEPTDASAFSTYNRTACWTDACTQAGHCQGGSMEPRVMAHSQTHRLRERMGEAAIGHGQEARVDLPGIRVAGPAGSGSGPTPEMGTIFFCTMGPIQVHEVLAPGDGGPLPTEVVLEGLVVPEPGTYDILNAVVHSNGDLRVRVDSATRLVQRTRDVMNAWL